MSDQPQHHFSASKKPRKALELRRGETIRYLRGEVTRLHRSDREGSTRYVLRDSDYGTVHCVDFDSADTASLEILDALPAAVDDVVAAAAIAEADGQSAPEPESRSGRINYDGTVVSIIAGADREDFVIGADQLPTIIDEQQAETGSYVVDLQDSEGRLIRLAISSDDVDQSLRSLAVMKAAGAIATKPATPSPDRVLWEYKVVRNMTADRLEANLNSHGASGWELVSMTGMDGVLTVTGNKLYAVLKRPRQVGGVRA